jgi:hypothetical protein
MIDITGLFIGIQLLDGNKMFGRVNKYNPLSIWVDIKGYEQPIEVPRDIMIRYLVVLDGGL